METVFSKRFSRKCTTSSQRKLPFSDQIREFMLKSRESQTLYANLDGYYDRRKLNYSEDGLSTLKEFISTTVSNGIGVIQSDQMVELPSLIVEKMIDSSRRYSMKDEIHFSVIWIYYFDYSGESLKSTPVFKVYKKKTGVDAVYIDTLLIQYETWDALVEKAQFPESFLCLPRHGDYNFQKSDDNQEILDLEFICKGRYSGSHVFASQPYSQHVMSLLTKYGVPTIDFLTQALDVYPLICKFLFTLGVENSPKILLSLCAALLVRKLLSWLKELLPCERKLLPCERKLLPCERKLLPCERKLLPCERNTESFSSIVRETVFTFLNENPRPEDLNNLGKIFTELLQNQGSQQIDKPPSNIHSLRNFVTLLQNPRENTNEILELLVQKSGFIQSILHDLSSHSPYVGAGVAIFELVIRGIKCYRNENGEIKTEEFMNAVEQLKKVFSLLQSQDGKRSKPDGLKHFKKSPESDSQRFFSENFSKVQKDSSFGSIKLWEEFGFTVYCLPQRSANDCEPFLLHLLQSKIKLCHEDSYSKIIQDEELVGFVFNYLNLSFIVVKSDQNKHKKQE